MPPTTDPDSLPEPVIPPAVAREAVRWLLALSEDGADRDRIRVEWQAWMDASPLHQSAWQRIADVDDQLREVPPNVAMQTLTAATPTRRRAMHVGALLAVACGGLLLVQKNGTSRQFTADLWTRSGEQRNTVLPDGTHLTLNTASAVDLCCGNDEQLVLLRAGEILLERAMAARHMLRVQTLQGTIRTLGARFSLRQYDGATAIAVLQGAVTCHLRAVAVTRHLQAGEQVRFTETAISPTQPLPAGAIAWARGMLVADDMPLGEFIAELARYREGVLRCAPEVAMLRVSGSYPLADTDRVLSALTRSLPVRIHRRTRWWALVEGKG